MKYNTILFVLLYSIIPSLSAQTISKCVRPDGSFIYQALPCAKDTRTEPIDISTKHSIGGGLRSGERRMLSSDKMYMELFDARDNIESSTKQIEFEQRMREKKERIDKEKNKIR